MATVESLVTELQDLSQALEPAVRYKRVLRNWIDLLEGKHEIDLTPAQETRLRARADALKARLKTRVANL